MRADSRRIGSLERLLHFKRIPSLAGLAPHDLAVLAAPARERFFPEGGVILREGEPTPAVHFVVEGRVRLERKGRDLGVTGPGSGIGALGILARDEHGVGAKAATDVLTLELESDPLLEALEDHFSILRHLLQEVARQLVDVQARTEGLGPPVPAGPLAVGRGDLDLVERILILRQAPPFARSSINALAELAQDMAERRFEPGATLWEVGDPAQSFFLVLEGEVACARLDGSPPVRFGPGTPVGAVEAVAGTSRWFRATAGTRLAVLSARAEGLFDVFEDNFEMALDYLAVLSRWLIGRLEARADGEHALGPFYGPALEDAAR